MVEWQRQPSLSVATAGALAAAALVLGFFSRGAFRNAGSDQSARATLEVYREVVEERRGAVAGPALAAHVPGVKR